MNDNKYIDVPAGYAPNDNEPFMSVIMKSYFREKLLEWKADLMDQTKDTMENLKAESVSHPDAIDRASATADRQLELRTP